MKPASSCLALSLIAAFTAWAGDAIAHPHVFVDAKVEAMFDDAGRLAAVRNIWKFDPAFSQYAIEGFDADEDGNLTETELAPLAQVNVDSLAEFGYFTYLTAADRAVELREAQDYRLRLDGEQLTLFYTLPLAETLVMAAPLYLEIFDAEYFVGFTFDQSEPFRLVDAPEECAGDHHLPEELDAQTMTILGQLPADQRSLPPDLAEAVKRLANYIEIDCGAGKQIASISDATAETMTVGEADESPTESLPRLALGLIIVFLSAGTAGVLWFRARRQ